MLNSSPGIVPTCARGRLQSHTTHDATWMPGEFTNFEGDEITDLVTWQLTQSLACEKQFAGGLRVPPGNDPHRPLTP